MDRRLMPELIRRPTDPDPLWAQERRHVQERLVTPWTLPIGLLCCVVTAVLLWTVPVGAPLFLVGVGAAGLAYAWAGSEAARRARLLDHLGLRPLADDAVPALTPLLRSAGRAKLGGVDDRRQLLVFTTSRLGRDDNTAEPHAPLTCTAVVYRGVPTPIGFLSARQHHGAARRAMNAKLGPSDRVVEELSVESVDLHERFDLSCLPWEAAQARRVFQPTFIVWFAEHGLPFEYEAGTLVVYVDRELSHSRELVELLSRADQIRAALGGA